MTIITKRLGYGGSAVIDGVQVLITGGNMVTAINSSFLEAYSIQPTTSSRSRFRHMEGTKAYSGSVTFDVTASAMGLFATNKLFQRGYDFDVGIDAGEDDLSQVMEDCYVTSLTLSGSVGGLVTANLSFISAVEPNTSPVTNNFIRDQEPLGYWNSGNVFLDGSSEDVFVRDWTISLTQETEPVYGNQNTPDPKYIKIGLYSMSFAVSTYTPMVSDGNELYIRTKQFTITGVRSQQEFAFGGITDLGTYRYEFISASFSDASGTVIAIT